MKMVGLSFAAALALAAAAPAAQAQDSVTACYKASAGTLKKFAVGDVPFKPCKVGKEEEVSLQMTGAAGLCGDGTLQAGEQCDDGGVAPGDGCSEVCFFEGGACGDGAIGIGEQCDDGNSLANDGCSDVCTFEAGACGDGALGLSEQCDDGNSANGDGCSSQCLGEADLATIPFFVVLDADNSTRDIATIGEFRVFVRCRANLGGNDRVSVVVTRTSAGWLAETTGAAVQAANAEVEMVFRSIATNAALFQSDIDEGYAVGPDGTYVGMDSEQTALGLNVFGHRCLAAGIIHTMTGFIPEVPVP